MMHKDLIFKSIQHLRS